MNNLRAVTKKTKYFQERGDDDDDDVYRLVRLLCLRNRITEKKSKQVTIILFKMEWFFLLCFVI